MSVSISKSNEKKNVVSAVKNESKKVKKEAEISKVVEITHHHHHRHHGKTDKQETQTTEKNILHKNSHDDSEESKWRATFRMVTKLLAKAADEKYEEPESDEDMRALLVEMTGAVCKKAKNPEETREYKALEAKYEHEQRKSKRMQKRAEKLLVEVEENRKRLDDHLKKVKLGEISETDKILKEIDELMVEQAENHRAFIQAETPSPVKRIRRRKTTENVKTELSPSDDSYYSYSDQ